MHQLSVHLSTPAGQGVEPQPLENLTDRVSPPVFGTAVPGGFSTCSFVVAATPAEVVEWYSQRSGYHVSVMDTGKLLWEGRIEDIGAAPGGVAVEALGYWASLTDDQIYQFWSSDRVDDWREATLLWASGTGLPSIPYSNYKYTTFLEGGIFVALTEESTYLEDEAAGFIFSLPLPPSGVDSEDFWMRPGEARYLSFDAEIIDDTFSDASDTALQIEIYYVDDYQAGTWTLYGTVIASGTGLAYLLPAGTRGILLRIGSGASGTKLYNNPTGDARVTITNLSVKPAPGFTSASEIIKQNVAGTGALSSPVPRQISQDTRFIQNSLNVVELTNIRYSATTLQEIFSQLGFLADSSALRSWFPAVWEGRRLHFGPRVIDRIKWKASVRDLADDGLSLTRTLENYWSSVQAFYTDADEIVQSVAPKEDPRYSDSVLVRRRAVLDMGSIPVTTVARDAFHEDFKIPQPRAEIQITGQVRDESGALNPPWRIRAGEVLQIVDLLPGRAPRQGGSLDPLRSFYIRETSYDAATGVMNVVPAWPADRLENLLANIEAITQN